MQTVNYHQRRSEIEAYFDRTASEAWSRLTSDAPVSRIRRTVRAGRDLMRSVILDWLPKDLRGKRILDAGCGAGNFAFEAAQRGANVLGVDLSPTLVQLARDRMPIFAGEGAVEFHVGDMLDASGDEFNYLVAMDSLIHYDSSDGLNVLSSLSEKIKEGMIFTFAPRTFFLGSMHTIGRLFPRSDRAPSIEPIAEKKLWNLLDEDDRLSQWSRGRAERVKSGFYISQACELVRC